MMKYVAIGAHLLRDDVEPVTDAFAVGDLFLSAMSVPEEQPVGDRELLVRAAGLRARLLDAATFVAIRYGFTFRTPEEAQSKCGAQLAQWRRVLTAHRDEVEMTLKAAASSPAARPDRHDYTSGAAYLRALHTATQSAHVDPELRAAAERFVVPLARQHRWTHRDEKSVELALLVPREKSAEVQAAGEALRQAAPDAPFLLSGPWPLEVFADDDQQ